MNKVKKNLIMVIDDSQVNLQLLFNFLSESEFKVLIAEHGLKALKILQKVTPDIILLDVVMPELDGFEICSKLKKSSYTKDIPVIFMTALSDPIDKLKGLSLGAVDYITKPFQKEEVLARVKLHIRLRKLTKNLQKQNQILKREIAARTEAEIALQELTEELEKRVNERTYELSKTVDKLENTRHLLLQREEKLKYDANHDTLTNLPNRAWLMRQMNFLIQRNVEHPDCLYAVLFIDLDRFKIVNDSLGHLVGDKLLKSVAMRLQTCLSKNETIVRFGGDEFIVLLQNIRDINDPIKVADEIKQQLSIPFQLQDYEVFTGASIGITISTMGYEQPEEVLRDVDVAMYYAKQAGRGCYEVFNPKMKTNTMAHLQLENDLRRAIVETRNTNYNYTSEFCLYYQPILSFSTGCIIGFEALIRWNHPMKGLISPVKFISVAEETGLIKDLGWWIFQEACRQLSLWQQQFAQKFPLVLNVNISAVQLKQVDLIKRINTILQQTQIPINCLKLEITESCILETSTTEAKILKQLKDLGIKLCIDDFGTGYSSLSRLHEFSIDTLKIDRSFIVRLTRSAEARGIIQTIITLAHSLGMDIVAEGIETSLQLEKLRELGCDFWQGYLFSKPVDTTAINQLLLNS
ncbi:MAG: EAL domain-containing protein [Microcoleaceae cyanobacterium]